MRKEPGVEAKRRGERDRRQKHCAKQACFCVNLVFTNITMLTLLQLYIACIFSEQSVPATEEMEDVAAVQEAIKAALEGFGGGQDLSMLLSSTLSESTKEVFQKFASKSCKLWVHALLIMTWCVLHLLGKEH